MEKENDKKNKKEENKNKKDLKKREQSLTKRVLQILIYITVFLVIVGGGVYLVKRNDIKIGFGSKKIPNPEITFNTNMGSFTAELYPDKAPNTVRNIIALAQSGYYNGKIIYGKDLLTMHMGRLPNGTQSDPRLSDIDQNIEKGSKEDIKYTIKGEFSANNFKDNDIPHERYTLSIARPDYTKILKNLRDQSYDSGSAMILIVLKAGEKLNGQYAAFGKIIEGRDVIDKIEQIDIKNLKAMQTRMEKETDPEKKEEMKKVLAEKLLALNAFETQPVIESVNINLKGIKYNLPEWIKAFNLEEYIQEKYTPDSKKTKLQRGTY